MEPYIKTVGVRILDIPYYLDIEYTYYIPDGFSREISRGTFLLVPFGAGNKKLSAVAVSLSETADYKNLKPIYSVSENDIALSEKMLRLADFLCGRTFCSFGDAVRRLVPSDLIFQPNEYFVLSENADLSKINEKTKKITDYLFLNGATKKEKLMEKTGCDSPEVLLKLVRDGILEKTASGKISDGAEITMIYPVEDADISLLDAPRTPDAYAELFSVIAECGAIEKKTLLSEGFKPSQIKGLEKRGLIRTEKIEYLRNPYKDIPAEDREINLSDAQKEARDSLLSLMDGKPHAALLYGVTGSGKTSVILSLCEEAVKKGGSAIVLVPEIALTWQSVSLFAGKFKDRLAVIHSALSEGEKADTFKRIRDGETDVVLGTRSAIFAPLSNISLIVIDEEQEHTYKSDMSPKYHARDIARFLCAEHGALMLLASATPSVESFYKAKNGTYSLVKLPSRYGNAKMPDIFISDMKENTDISEKANIGDELAAEIQKNLDDGFQSVLFLNRRGYNSYFSCRSCGKTMLCPNCSVALTYHIYKKSGKGYLQCHYCGYRIPTPSLCPLCGSEHISGGGFGTQKIEEELHEKFPSAKISRLDADSTRTKFSQDKILSDFREGKADILIGTQMVTKGHNFPRVTLVGIVSADNLLFMNDFRSGEQTFSVITQVAGRAGRGDFPGRAMIQTFDPENEIFTLSAMQNYEKFYESEIAMRKTFVFPPFCDMAMISLSSTEETALGEFSRKIADDIKKTQSEEFSDVPIMMFGPFDAPVYKIGGKFRKHIMIKHKNTSRSRELFSMILKKYGKLSRGKITISIDINPTSSM